MIFGSVLLPNGLFRKIGFTITGIGTGTMAMVIWAIRACMKWTLPGGVWGLRFLRRLQLWGDISCSMTISKRRISLWPSLNFQIQKAQERKRKSCNLRCGIGLPTVKAFTVKVLWQIIRIWLARIIPWEIYFMDQKAT